MFLPLSKVTLIAVFSIVTVSQGSSTSPKSSCVEVEILWENAAYCNTTEQTECSFKLVTGLTNTNCTETSFGITANQEDELFEKFTQAFEQLGEKDALGPESTAGSLFPVVTRQYNLAKEYGKRTAVKQFVGRCGNYALRLEQLKMENLN